MEWRSQSAIWARRPLPLQRQTCCDCRYNCKVVQLDLWEMPYKQLTMTGSTRFKVPKHHLLCVTASRSTWSTCPNCIHDIEFRHSDFWTLTGIHRFQWRSQPNMHQPHKVPPSNTATSAQSKTNTRKILTVAKPNTGCNIEHLFAQNKEKDAGGVRSGLTHQLHKHCI